MQTKVKTVLDKILDLFQSGAVPQAIALRQFPVIDVPCNKWSFLNQLLVYINDTQDARGFRQWHSANRYVKKGSKSFDILVPLIKKAQNDNEEESIRLFGFRSQAVFKVEDTDGEELPSNNLLLPELPLMDKAISWGIEVKAVSGNDAFNGYYASSLKQIGLASPDECIFFHELCHYADEQVVGKLKGKQDPIQEIVAELGALTLCSIVGKDGSVHIGNSYKYIESYAKELKQTAHSACISVLNRVGKTLDYILNTETGGQDVQPSTCR